MQRPHVAFFAKGPIGFSIAGKGESIEARDDGAQLTVSVPLRSLRSGNALLDHHMNGYLETARHPSAVLRVAREAVRFPAPGAPVSADAEGELELHGKTRRLRFHYDASRDDGGFDVKGTLRINIKDFAIEVPRYLGVTVKPDVDVEVAFRLDAAR